jgi:hypothetical protein
LCANTKQNYGANNMSENTELALLPARENAVQVFSAPNGLDPFLAKIRAEIDAFVPDISTKKGRDAIASMAYKVAKSKTALDGLGKELVVELKQIPALIDAERKRMRDTLDAWRDEVRKPVDDWEAEQKAIEEKRLADEAEAERVRLAEIAARELQEQVDRDHELAIYLYADYLREKEAAAKQAIIDAELAAKAQKEREEQIAREAAENARIEAERAAAAEQQRIKDEAARQAAEAQAAIERAQREKAEAEAEAIRQQQAAEQAKAKAKADAEAAAKAAEERAEREKQAAIEAERQRVERERLEAERVQQELEKNRAHVGQKRKEAKEALMLVCGLSEDVAKSVVMAIAQSKIDNTEIKY